VIPLRPWSKAPTNLARFRIELERLRTIERLERARLDETLWECPEPGCEAGHVRTFAREGGHVYVTTRTCEVCEGQGTVEAIVFEAWCRARAAEEHSDDDP
jgi:DnaJ-class molecular chaperone